MKTKEPITDVIFRADKHGKFKDVVFALLPHEVSTLEGLVTCYHHIGQHSSADYNYCVSKSRLANPKEYANLKREMEQNAGYKFNVIKRQNHDKYIASYREVNQSVYL